MKKLLVIAAVVLALLFLYRSSKNEPVESTPSTPKPVESTPRTPPTGSNPQTTVPNDGTRRRGDSPTFAGGSGDWGSGHEAGYNWAEEHDIDDEDDCDTAGETSNSPSFAEGCRAYVEENAPDKDDGSGDDIPDGD